MENGNNIQVLLIEDNPTDALLLREAVREDALSSFEFTLAETLESAADLLRQQQFDAILLDLGLPDGQGLDSFTTIHGEFPDRPIVVLSGLADQRLALEAVQSGAQDYLVKGPAGWEVAARAIRYAIERKRMQERLHFMATHDALTGLPNRELFHDRLTHAIERARRTRSGNTHKWKLAVMMLDLDNFKTVNDKYGHAEGDKLLQAVTAQLKTAVRESDTVARMGGDEFTLISENVSGTDDAEVLAKRVLAVFEPPFHVGGHEFKITASLGISLFPRDGHDVESLFKNADIAMYRAKEDKGTFKFYEHLDAA
ncbi:MAG: GGDEF domain-containing response regulator [Chloroflexota bacterium]